MSCWPRARKRRAAFSTCTCTCTCASAGAGARRLRAWRISTAAFAASTALLCSAAAWADPMRPLPQPLAAPAPAASAGEAATPAGAAAATNTPAAAPARLLQAIRSDSQGQHLALFGDRWLRAGDQFTAVDGQAPVQVLSIGPNQVDVQQGGVRHTHFLLPPLLPGQWPTRPATPAAAQATKPALATPAGNKPAPTSNPAVAPSAATSAPAAPVQTAAGMQAPLPSQRPAR